MVPVACDPSTATSRYLPDMGELLTAALRARDRAYAPYSGYAVGAAVEDQEGRVFFGCNVENVAYGSTLCAERNAVTRMIAEGGRRLRRLALVTADGATPCGACLQVLREFVADPNELEVALYAEDRLVRSITLTELLPLAFVSDSVKQRTEETSRPA